jgi:ubiquinone biosynthesis protein UbiJ
MSQDVATTEVNAVDPMNTPEVNRAAYDFSRLVTKIKTDTTGLSLRSINRILMNVVEYPFNKNTSRLTDKEKDIIFHIALANQCKDTMLKALRESNNGIKQQLEELKESSEGEENVNSTETKV